MKWFIGALAFLFSKPARLPKDQVARLDEIATGAHVFLRGGCREEEATDHLVSRYGDPDVINAVVHQVWRRR